MNLRPSGYEPDELPDCSIPRHWCRGSESNRYECLHSQDFKSCASASFATPAKLALRVGFEPTTYRLTAGCSTIELPKNTGLTPRGSSLVRQYPTFPSRYQPSIIGAWRLNFRVRYGYGWDPPAMVTGPTTHSPKALVKSSAD